ncbi:MAG: hypothetical protein WC523_06110 [Patescibacteria group bacterium]|jgi:hypothetical protein
MEEEKKHEVKDGHKFCHCLDGHCGCKSTGHKVVKIILALAVVIALLSIGAAFGSRASRWHGENYYSFGRGCGFNNSNDWQERGFQTNRRQFRMMIPGADNNQGTVVKPGDQINIPNIPAAPSANTSTNPVQ